MTVGVLPQTATADGYSAIVLSSEPDISSLDAAVDRLMPARDAALTARFALASLDDSWAPRVVVVSSHGSVVGIVFGKERMVGGFATGLIYVDGRLGHLVVSKPAESSEILLTAIRALFALPRVRGLRLVMSPSGADSFAIPHLRAGLPLDLLVTTPESYELHARLPLPSDYESFLGSLGHQTRRNFRYYRRKSEAAGHCYVDQVPPGELESILARLRTKSRIPFSVGKMKSAARTVLATDRPWVVGLRRSTGEYLSVAGGWFDNGRATMLLQLNNDLECGDASPSVVLRGYLIETLIGQRMTELMFWSGSAPPLSRYAQPLPAISVHLDARTLAWRMVRGMIGATQPFIGRWVGTDVRWIAGSRGSADPRHRERHPPATP
jgi:hypothetical protein